MQEDHSEWLARTCATNQGIVSYDRGTLLYHGYRFHRPVLDNMRALWLAEDPEEALMYAQSSGPETFSGVLCLRLVDDVAVPRTQTTSARFLGTFDPDRRWENRHETYAKILHEWGTSRNLPGIVEEHGNIVLFQAANFLEIISEKGIDAFDV